MRVVKFDPGGEHADPVRLFTNGVMSGICKVRESNHQTITGQNNL